jgi:hypothetical protein
LPKWPSDSTCNCKLNEQKDTLQVLSHFFQYFLKLWYGELYRQSCLNLYECSLKKLKNIIMRSIEISKKSTAFIPARQTDKSCWKTLPCHRLKYRWNRQLSFVRDRPTFLNLYGCSQNKVKNFTVSSFEISMKSTAFIPARQTDKSGWNTSPCQRCLKYRWNRQLSFLRDRPTSLDLYGCVLNKLKHVIVSNSDVYPDSELIQCKQAD